MNRSAAGWTVRRLNAPNDGIFMFTFASENWLWNNFLKAQLVSVSSTRSVSVVMPVFSTSVFHSVVIIPAACVGRWGTLTINFFIHFCRSSASLTRVVIAIPVCSARSLSQGGKTIKKNTNSTQNKSQTHRAKQYEVTSLLSTDCELSTETCSKNVYSLGPSSRVGLPCPLAPSTEPCIFLVLSYVLQTAHLWANIGVV